VYEQPCNLGTKLGVVLLAAGLLACTPPRPALLHLAGGGRTLLQVVMQGGGPLSTADLSQTLLYRTSPDGRVLRFEVNRVLARSDIAQNVPVQPLDVVLVPKKGVASLDVWVDQYVRQALPIPASVLLALVRGRVPF
jgi:protein involved in polysaccharide export with SLBB domain